jgi:hypothetical protein
VLATSLRPMNQALIFGNRMAGYGAELAPEHPADIAFERPFWPIVAFICRAISLR